MSYASGTTHYDLPQTAGSDKRDWSDTNTAFAAIDAAIYQSVTDAGTAASAAAAAQTTANAAQTAATNAGTAASGAQATATSAAELAQTAKNRADAAYTAAGNAATAASGAQSTADAALPKSDVVDNLTTNDATKALSAKQGKALNDNKLANSRLTANSQNAQLSYVDGKYGFTIGGVFYPLGGSSMKDLDYSSIKNFTKSESYTVPSDGVLYLAAASSSTYRPSVQINSHELISEGVGSNNFSSGINWELPVKAGDVIVTNVPTQAYLTADFIPYA